MTSSLQGVERAGDVFDSTVCVDHSRPASGAIDLGDRCVPAVFEGCARRPDDNHVVVGRHLEWRSANPALRRLAMLVSGVVVDDHRCQFSRLLAALLLCLAACVTAEDYKDPAVGGTALSAVEYCRANPELTCGWVYSFQDGAIEFCLPWEDRSPIYKLRETAESLYGTSELARDPRFHGVPLCYWQCPPPPKGCNAKTVPIGGCFCLTEAPQ